MGAATQVEGYSWGDAAVNPGSGGDVRRKQFTINFLSLVAVVGRGNNESVNLMD